MGRKRKVFKPNEIKDLDEVIIFMATAPKQKRVQMLDLYDAMQFYQLCIDNGFKFNGLYPRVEGANYRDIDSHVENLILEKVYETDNTWYLTSGKKGGLTRRVGRVQEFINRKSRELRRNNPGFYSVSFNSWRDRNLGNELGVVWARNQSDALIVANQMYGVYSTSFDPMQLRSDYVDVDLISPGTDLGVISKSTNDVKKSFKHTIQRKQEAIAELQKEIEAIEQRQHAVLQTLSDVNGMVLDELLAEPKPE